MNATCVGCASRATKQGRDYHCSDCEDGSHWHPMIEPAPTPPEPVIPGVLTVSTPLGASFNAYPTPEPAQATATGLTLQEIGRRAMAALMQNREAYVRAWVAATGLDPRDCVLVEQIRDEGGTTIRVVSKAEPSPAFSAALARATEAEARLAALESTEDTDEAVSETFGTCLTTADNDPVEATPAEVVRAAGEWLADARRRATEAEDRIAAALARVEQVQRNPDESDLIGLKGILRGGP